MIDVEAELKAALKARDAVALTAWRSVKTKAGVKLTEPGRDGAPLTEAEQQAILRREIKERAESNEYLQPGDPKHAENRRIAEILEAHLPQAPSEAETDALIAQAIAQVAAEQGGAPGPRDMGKVMAALRKAHPALDMGYASKAVKARLAGA